MGIIIRNAQTNGTIGRKVDTILRTPIIKRIYPDQKKICQIGDPRSVDSMGYLTGGFHGNNTYYTTVDNVGYQLINEWINGQPKWMDASGNHDPEFVWYQGAYATTAATIVAGKWMSEAYASLPGFHFTFPSIQSPLAIIEVTVYFDNMGATWAYGPSLDGNVNNKNIKQADYGWDGPGFPVQFHVLNTPTCNYHPMDIANNSPYDSFDIAHVGTAGSFRGYRDIFLKAPLGTVDGCIPILTNTVRESYTMSSTTFSHFTQNGHGWIVPCMTPWLQLNPTTYLYEYRPCSGSNGDGRNNYWACASLRDVYIDVVIDAV